MARYRSVLRKPSVTDMRSAPGNGEEASDQAAPSGPPAKMSQSALQSVLDEAHEQGILEEPADAAEARAQGVTAARIDTVEGEQVLVERVEPAKPKPRRKAKR